MKGTKYLFLAATALSLAACSSDDENMGVNDNPVAAQITAGINDVLTRATGMTWEANDAIGISTYTPDGETATLTNYANKKYVTTAGNGTFTRESGAEASGIFFQDANETVHFRAYYPFQGTDGTDAETITGITTSDQRAQKNFDFMFAEGATASKDAPAIKFDEASNATDARFKHKMTRLILNITTDANSGFSASDIAGGIYSLSGIIHSGSFNTATGTAAATGSVTTHNWEITDYTSVAGNVRTCSLIFYPQSGTSLTFKATIDGQDYTSEEFTPALNASTSYEYDITIKKTGVTVSDCTIADWGTPVDGGSIDAEM